MIHLNLHQKDPIESHLPNSSFSEKLRVFSPFTLTTYQTNRNQRLPSRNENQNTSGNTNSRVQKRRALRNILHHDHPKPQKKHKNLQVRGLKQPSHQLSLSPVLRKNRKSLLSPISPLSPKLEKLKSSQTEACVKSISMSSFRRSVLIEPFIGQYLDIDSNEESLRISAKYSHNN